MTTSFQAASLELLNPPNPLALRLGYAGLAPFVGGALFVWLLAGHTNATAFSFVVDALAKYAALVVSFLGGLNWGLVMRSGPEAAARGLTRRTLYGGTAYSIAAWVAVCMPAHAGLVVLGAVLIACYFSDRKTYPALGAAAWLTLRFRLTSVASLSCFLAAAQI